MIRLLRIFLDWPRKSVSNFAIFAQTKEEARVSSSIYKVNDTFVSDASFNISIKWLVKN